MLKLTAIHEGAHVVTAYLSKYHFITGQISLFSDTEGETFVTLSRKKIRNSNKQISEELFKDIEIVKDAAIVFYSGFESEKIYNDENGIEVEKEYSMNDYNNVNELIKNCLAPQTIKTEELILESKMVVTENWLAITKISAALLEAQRNSLNAEDAIQILDAHYDRYSF